MRSNKNLSTQFNHTVGSPVWSAMQIQKSQIQSTGMECDVDLEISNSIHNAIDAWDFEGAYNITYLSKSCFIFWADKSSIKIQ